MRLQRHNINRQPEIMIHSNLCDQKSWASVSTFVVNDEYKGRLVLR